MGNEWGSSGLKSCHLEEKVELPAGSERVCRPWSLYRAVSTDAGSECALSAFVYSLSTDSAGSTSPHIQHSETLQAAENNTKVVLLKRTTSVRIIGAIVDGWPAPKVTKCKLQTSHLNN